MPDEDTPLAAGKEAGEVLSKFDPPGVTRLMQRFTEHFYAAKDADRRVLEGVLSEALTNFRDLFVGGFASALASEDAGTELLARVVRELQKIAEALDSRPAPPTREVRKSLTPVRRRLVQTSANIMARAPHQDAPDKIDFLHSALCQIGMPRSRVEQRSFTRTNGAISLKLDAGDLWDGREWRPQPLPYGVKPRLVMVHVSSEAVRTKSREIEVGHSIRGFLETLGVGTSGGTKGPFTAFKAQMMALAACHLTIGFSGDGKAETMDSKPIERFSAWLHPTGQQRTLWPGTLTLSPRFFETLVEFAVPLDKRAIGALQHSALALDAYTWLAHRLCRIKQTDGVRLSWENLHAQFGQEYSERRDFKREMRKALAAALAVYPDARVEDENGGIRLLPSPPPVPKTMVSNRR